MKTLLKSTFVLLVMALVFSLGCTGQRWASRAASTISGTVRDPSGVPAADVIVSVHPGHYPAQPKYAETRTDANGQYSLKLQENDYIVFEGMIIETNCILARDIKRNLAVIREFVGEPHNIDLTLQPGITLSGFVKDTKGGPIANATVNLGFYAPGGIMWYNLGLQPVPVDAQGQYSFPALLQGCEYLIAPIAAKGYGSTQQGLSANRTQTNRFEFRDIVLNAADRELAGLVVGPDGKPFAGATVNFNGLGQRVWPTTKSDGTGHFVFDQVCEGPVNLSANWNAPIENGRAPLWGLTANGIKAQGGDANIVIQLRAWQSNP